MRFEKISFRVHDPPLRVFFEGSVPGIAEGSVRHGDLKEAIPLNGDIQTIASRLEAALGKNVLGGHLPGTMPHLNPGRQHVVIAGRCPGLSDRLVNQILKLCSHLLESGGADVRQIVGDDVDIRLLRHHAGPGCPQ